MNDFFYLLVHTFFCLFSSPSLSISGVKSRYSQMYIPSDFINVKSNWQQSFPMNRPLKFNSRCLFHVMNKDAHSVNVNDAQYDPPDADHRWAVKVLYMIKTKLIIIELSILMELYGTCFLELIFSQCGDFSNRLFFNHINL